MRLVLDSAGLQLFGQGEWDAEKHGRMRWKWRKLHLAVDAVAGEIALGVLTDGAHDGEPTHVRRSRDPAARPIAERGRPAARGGVADTDDTAK